MMSTVFCFPKRKRKEILRFCKILATGSYIPEKTVINEEIIRKYGLPFKSSVIIRTIGVEKRRIAEDYQDDSDLLCFAAKQCLESYGLMPERLSRLIVNKYMGDNILPMTASQLQSKLGSRMANHAFDLDGGISSFLFALDLGMRYIATGDEYVLIASGGVNNRLISKTDPRVDASASILLGPSAEQHILASYFYSNHEHYHLATARGIRFLRETSFERDPSDFYDTYKMGNWKDAEDFYRSATKEIFTMLQEESGLSISDIDLVLVTENNASIRNITLETLGVGEDRSISLLREHGNTMSAMLPLLLDYGWKNGRIHEGMNILLISHGEGISGGGIIYRV
jgi:3-oxoacyl-[acyl-carrier-protein] synthase-3